MIGTTSLGFNLFLGGAMAKGRRLREAFYGIALSTVLALVVSFFILVVGSGAEGGDDFKTSSLTKVISNHLGIPGEVIFSLAFIAAAR